MVRIALAGAWAANAPATTWQMTTGFGSASFHTKNIHAFAEDITAVSAGALQIDIRSDPQLVHTARIVDAVGKGEVALGEVSLSRLGSRHAAFSVDTVPFLVSNYYKAEKLWKASMPAIKARLRRFGVKLLYVVPWPPKGIYTTRDVKATRELRGMRIRTYSVSTTRLIEALGAIPVSIAPGDIRSAFKNGRLDAMFSSAPSGVSLRAWEFAAHFYLANAWIPKNAVIVNEKAFAGIAPNVQSVVLESARRAQARGWRLSQREHDAKTGVLRQQGLSIHKLAGKLRIGFGEIGRKMTFAWSDKAGDEGIQMIEQYYLLD